MTSRSHPAALVRASVLLALLCAWCCGSASGQTEKLPPKPAAYFDDQAHVVDQATAYRINEQLAQFERDTSNQILVAIFPSLPSGADPAQYSIDTGNAWQAGEKGKDNGAVLFVYVQDHQIFIATGRGLEGALPDITCNQIIRQEIAPAFKQGDYAGGIQAGVNAMIAASKGEYKGDGQTNNEAQGANGTGGRSVFFTFLVILFIIIVITRSLGSGFGAAPFIFTGGGWGGGGGFGGGGGGGGGGFSGFSGGGGSFGGGGAGGSW